MSESVPKGLRYWAGVMPERRALVFHDGEISYGELEDAVNRLARLLRRLGLRRGDHLAALVGNGPTVFVVATACLRTGVYFTPISTSLTAPEVAQLIRDCQASVVVTDTEHAGLIASLASDLPAVRTWLCHGVAQPPLEDLGALVSAESSSPLEDEYAGAFMLYTSGTTGAPRGVWRPLPETIEAALVPPMAVELTRMFGLVPHLRYLSPAPLYHASPLQFSIATLALGGTAFVMRKFDAADALQLLQEHEITYSQWVPTMFQRMLQLPESVRNAFRAPAHQVAIHAAAPCPPVVKRAMLAWWGPILREFYGGSEGVGNTRIDAQEWLRKPGSVGRAVKGQIHIIGGNGGELGPGQAGKIYFSGTSQFEYFGDPVKTFGRRHPLGYQTLGDIGYVDEEGYLFLTDRQDDMLISGGVNVYPQEIEAVLMEMSGVSDCGVVGVADESFGERPVAFVVAAAGQDVAALQQRLDAHAAQRLGRIKRPDRIVFIDELPRSATGKLLRRELRAQLTRTTP